MSPALISHVVRHELGIAAQVVDLGCPVAPAVPHIRLGESPARCLSTGAALSPHRVEQLLGQGHRWGRRWASRGRAPLLVAECVPGGTSTALAVLVGLGVAASGLVSGSLREPAHALKGALVSRGLRAAGLERPGEATDPLAVLAAVGDPMQPLGAGLVLGAVKHGSRVLLAGGSQMAAVLALALALAPEPLRRRLAAAAAIGTTAWVAGECGSDLVELLRRIGARWGVEPLGFATDLRFDRCRSQALRDYERGYVKEGVGAGGLALLWELSGRDPQSLAAACDTACEVLQTSA